MAVCNAPAFRCCSLARVKVLKNEEKCENCEGSVGANFCNWLIEAEGRYCNLGKVAALCCFIHTPTMSETRNACHLSRAAKKPGREAPALFIAPEGSYGHREIICWHPELDTQVVFRALHPPVRLLWIFIKSTDLFFEVGRWPNLLLLCECVQIVHWIVRL